MEPNDNDEPFEEGVLDVKNTIVSNSILQTLVWLSKRFEQPR